LTNETITADPEHDNGDASYSLDPVGNRLSDTSSIPDVPSGSYGYNADDEVNTETYDQNGNTLTTSGKVFSYDSENHLTAMNGSAVALVYDGDGNRVAKTVAGVTTTYLVDDLNPTGYAQVVEELTAGAVTRQYTYGLQRISENQPIENVWAANFYGYDGGGNVRTLTNTAGAITDTYSYDAFGNQLLHTGSTSNNYLYRGEQYDPDLGLYYLRARYYNPATGRFMSRDPENGYSNDPNSLHKYLYANGDPVNRIDATGRGAVLQFLFTTAVISTPTEVGLVALVGGTAATVTTWAIAVEVAVACAINIQYAMDALKAQTYEDVFPGGFCSAKSKNKTCRYKCYVHRIGMPNHQVEPLPISTSATAKNCAAACDAAWAAMSAQLALGFQTIHCPVYAACE
jgi:RHS repeat-associated protein